MALSGWFRARTLLLFVYLIGIAQMNVLLVEDDAVSRRIFQRNLARQGHGVVHACDGVEAWAVLQREPIRIVVSDWMMPRMDGLELCRRVRGRPDVNYTYFIMLTARLGEENYREAMAAGVDDFLTKPLDPEELEIRLRVAGRILGYATQLRQLRTLLPICLYCKKIRDDHDSWQRIDEYIHQHTGTDFSHTICPDCFETITKPELEAVRREQDDASPQEVRS
jgi:sigma-B regulation protein RsbU (phosphoserine phosphatase)